MPNDIAFITLLEQYVFSVADQFIEGATDKEQTCLITLFNTVGNSSSSNNRPDELPLKDATRPEITSSITHITQLDGQRKTSVNKSRRKESSK